MEALLYDVHGNLPALEAVLGDAKEATSFILGGDHGSAADRVRTHPTWGEVVAKRLEQARYDV